MHGAWVQSLVGELRAHVLLSQKKHPQNKTNKPKKQQNKKLKVGYAYTLCTQYHQSAGQNLSHPSSQTPGHNPNLIPV